MKRIIAGMLAIMSLTACGPSEAQVAIAIAETEAARPTETSTPTQTPTPTPTPTPTAMPTSTATPEPSTSLGMKYEEAESFFEDLSGAFLTFEYVYDLGSTQVYESYWYDAGVVIYLMRKEELVAGVMMVLNDKPSFDVDKAVDFMVNTLTSFAGSSAVDFVVNGWPEAVGDSVNRFFKSKEGP